MNTEEPEDTYGIEPTPKSVPDAASSPASDQPAPGTPRMGRPITEGGGPTIVPSGNSEPLGLEDETPLSQRPIKDLDVCPNCGASMGGTGEILCMRCGFDLKTMRTVNVQTGVVEVSDENDPLSPDGERTPMVVPGMGNFMLPLATAGVVGVIMIAAMMLGVRGLFPPVVNAQGDVVANGDITIGMRFLGVLKMVVNVGMLGACGLGALWFMSFLLSRRVGDWKLAAARMLGIVAVMQLVMFFNMGTYSWEWTVEAIIQAIIFAGASMVLLGIKPKDTPTLLGSTVCLYLILWFGSWVISRVAGG